MMNIFDEAERVDRDELASAVRKTPKLPRNTPRIERLRVIVRDRSAARVEGLFVDGYTASMLVQVHDALNEENRVKFLALPLRKMVAVGWKLAGK